MKKDDSLFLALLALMSVSAPALAVVEVEEYDNLRRLWCHIRVRRPLRFVWISRPIRRAGKSRAYRYGRSRPNRRSPRNAKAHTNAR